MIDKIKKIYSENILKVLFILFPIIELTTSILIMNDITLSITPGMLFKTLFLFYGLFYLVFINKKDKKWYYVLLLALFLVVLLNVIITMKAYSINNIVRKTTELLKFVTLPIMTMFFIAFNRNGNHLPMGIFLISALILILNMLIAIITGTALPTYSKLSQGYTGWHYSANELGAFLMIIFPIAIYYMLKTKTIGYAIIVALFVYGLASVGTKVALLGLILTILAVCFYKIVANMKKSKVMALNIILVFLVCLIILLVIFPYIPGLNRLIKTFTSGIRYGREGMERFIFSGRAQHVREQSEKYLNSSLAEKFFGIEEGAKRIENGKFKLVERDFHDLLYNYGIIGLLLYISGIIYVYGTFIKKTHKKFHIKVFFLHVIIILTLLASYLAGHMLQTPTIAIYLSMILAVAFNIDIEEKNDKKQKVMFICSVGGHLTQMLQVKKLFNKYDYVLITEKTEVTKSMKEKYNMRYLIHGSRQYMFSYIIKELYNVLKTVVFYVKYCPNTVVTTGTHTAVPMCYLAKAFGKKVIFIESFAKRTSPTKSGKMVYPIADIFVIQWESLKEFYPKAEVWGWIY